MPRPINCIHCGARSAVQVSTIPHNDNRAHEGYSTPVFACTRCGMMFEGRACVGKRHNRRYQKGRG